MANFAKIRRNVPGTGGHETEDWYDRHSDEYAKPAPEPTVKTRELKESAPSADTEKWPTAASERRKRRMENDPTGTSGTAQ